MAEDLATLSLKLDNVQMLAGLKATGEAAQDMGRKGVSSANALEASILKQARATQQSANVTVSSTRGMDAFSALQAEAAGHVGEHSLALGRLERSMGEVTIKTLGLNPQLGLLGESLGKFALGSIEMVAVLAAFAALSYAWDKYTEGSRKAKEETDKALSSLQALADKQRLGRNTTGDAAAKASIDLFALKDKIAEERATIASGGLDPHDFQVRAKAQKDLVADLVEEDRLNKLIGAHYKELNDLAEAEKERHDAIVYANEERVRLAQQALDEVGLEGAALAEMKAQHEAINELIKARRDLHGRDLTDTEASIEAERRLRIEAGTRAESIANAIKDSREAEKAAKEAAAAIDKTFDDLFTRIFGSGKSMFQKLANEVIRPLFTQVSAQMYSMASLAMSGGSAPGGLSNAGIATSVFGGALVGGGVGYAVGSATGSRGAGALSGAASGALVGAQLGGPWGAVIGGAVGLVAGFFSVKHSAEEAAKTLHDLTQVSATLADWRAQITGLASDQKAAAELDLKMKYLGIQADIERLEAGKKMEQQRNKDLASAAELYAQALAKSADSVTGAFSDLVNMVTGYKLQSTIFKNVGPFTPPAPVPPGGDGGGPGGDGGPTGGDLEVKLMLDGSLVGKAVLKNFKAKAQSQFGDSSKWALVQ